MIQKNLSQTPVFDRGNLRRMREAKQIIGEDYLDRLIVKVGPYRLDPENQSGSILIIAELMGLLRSPSELYLSGEPLPNKDGMRRIVARCLRDLDWECVFLRFAEQYEEELRKPKTHSSIRLLMNACRLGDQITVEILPQR
ncbi:MAG: hypothetical protein IPN70_00335 [Candidatus Moraniibacteriota bacterium]|nr:MAG: hypothetical protein IPN70_00335 [Candidatus Moranbacteria bacterium]